MCERYFKCWLPQSSPKVTWGLIPHTHSICGKSIVNFSSVDSHRILLGSLGLRSCSVKEDTRDILRLIKYEMLPLIRWNHNNLFRMFFPKKKAVVLSLFPISYRKTSERLRVQDLTNNCLQRWFKRMKKILLIARTYHTYQLIRENTANIL